MAKKTDAVCEKSEKQSIALNIDDIKTIFELMKANDIGELKLEKGDMKLKVLGNKHMSSSAVQSVVVSAAPVASSAPAPVAPVAEASVVLAAPTAEVRVIRSPMVGTFYGRPTPESPEFVKEGVSVDDESVVCLIEAMKLFNEIKAELSGRIVRCLVKDGSPVEYNQPLFEVE